MAENTRSQLERAYMLIQQEKMDQALGILKPVLAKDPNNVDGWWLMANAVSEPEAAREALEQVLRLNPKHAEARDLLNQLNEAVAQPVGGDDFGDLNFDDPFAGLRDTGPEQPETVSEDNPFAEDVIPSFVRETPSPAGKAPRDFTVGDEDAALESSTPAVDKGKRPTFGAPQAGNSRLPLLIGLVAVLVIILALVFIVLPKLNQGQNPTATGTAIAAVPTQSTSVPSQTTASQPTATTPAITVATSEPTAASIASTASTVSTAASTGAPSTASVVTAVLSQFNASPSASNVHNVQGGINASSVGNQTLTLSFCSPFGPKMSATVNAAMDILAAQAAPASTQFQGIAVAVYSCTDSSQVLYKAVSPIADVVGYVNKSMDVHKFRAGWQSQ